MQVAARKVLETLRQSAEPKPQGEWAKVNPRSAYCELVADLDVGEFGSILHHLKSQGYYRRIDDLHGEVKMDDPWPEESLRHRWLWRR